MNPFQVIIMDEYHIALVCPLYNKHEDQASIHNKDQNVRPVLLTSTMKSSNMWRGSLYFENLR